MIPPAPDAGDGEFARTEALSGLAREVETLTRTIETLVPVPGRVDELARLVGQLAEAVAAVSARPSSTAAPSWLLAPGESIEVEHLIGELSAWLHAVFLRYPDGAAVLPECWLYHPDVVEELLWLMYAWCAAYQGKNASVGLAGDWHDRQRPGVVRRLQKSVGACSIETHLTRVDWNQRPAGAAEVPGLAESAVLAEWWAQRRDDPAPEPTNVVPFGAVRNGARHR
jgi:hypothetical protein